MSSTRSVNIHYYAVFREQRGLSTETRNTAATSLRELYAELSKAHGFSLPLERVQVAVDDEFVDWDTAVTDKATVVFIPPVAGG